MKIFILVMSFGPSGGMRVITELANSWSEIGNKVDILVVYDSEPYFPISEQVNVLCYKSTCNSDARKKAINLIRKKENDYDVFIATYWVSALILDKSVSAKDKSFYYIQAYEPDFHERKTVKQILKKYLAKYTYSLPLKKIVNSNLYKNYKSIHTNRVVYPGLNLKIYYPKDVSFFNKTIRIGTIGRNEEWKGTADVCKAMEILKSEGIDFDFYIAFNDYDTIPHYFVCPDGDDKLSAFYRDMDIVVAACKGQYGAIHYPVIETMAVGSTIVCTDYYPANEYNAYKVDGSAPEQIAKSIKKIIVNKEEAIIKRKQALKDIQQFDWPMVAQKFLMYLQEGLNKDDNAK